MNLLNIIVSFFIATAFAVHTTFMNIRYNELKDQLELMGNTLIEMNHILGIVKGVHEKQRYVHE